MGLCHSACLWLTEVRAVLRSRWVHGGTAMMTCVTWPSPSGGIKEPMRFREARGHEAEWELTYRRKLEF